MLKALLKPTLAAGIALAAIASPAVTAPLAAQSATKVAVVNLPAVVVNSNAYKTAQTQLQPLVTAFNTARQAANPNQTSLQQQAAQIQQIQQQGQQELQQILAPVALSQAYVEEQIQDQLQTAISNAATAARVQIVLSPDSVLFADNSLNLNEQVLAQLNTLIPNAQLVPPQGWLPREIREQQEAATAAQAQQPAASGR